MKNIPSNEVQDSNAKRKVFLDKSIMIEIFEYLYMLEIVESVMIVNKQFNTLSQETINLRANTNRKRFRNIEELRKACFECLSPTPRAPLIERVEQYGRTYGYPINEWIVSDLKDFSCAFHELSDFNHKISNWDVSNARNMCAMFRGCSRFNQDLSKWNTANVTDMSWMFKHC
jgi:surface protein